jgi:hypothetical protein
MLPDYCMYQTQAAANILIYSIDIYWLCIWSGGRSQCAKSLPPLFSKHSKPQKLKHSPRGQTIQRQSAQSASIQCLLYKTQPSLWRKLASGKCSDLCSKTLIGGPTLSCRGDMDGGVLVHRWRPSSAIQTAILHHKVAQPSGGTRIHEPERKIKHEDERWWKMMKNDEMLFWMYIGYSWLFLVLTLSGCDSFAGPYGSHLDSGFQSRNTIPMEKISNKTNMCTTICYFCSKNSTHQHGLSTILSTARSD